MFIGESSFDITFSAPPNMLFSLLTSIFGFQGIQKIWFQVQVWVSSFRFQVPGFKDQGLDTFSAILSLALLDRGLRSTSSSEASITLLLIAFRGAMMRP